jgi:hypothetical protein
MPVDHIATIVRTSGPERAAAILASLPADRLIALAEALGPAALADVLLAADPAGRDRLLITMPADRTADVLSELSAEEAADVLASVPPEVAARVLLAESAPVATHILTAASGDVRERLCQTLEAAGSPVPGLVYQRLVAASLCRLVPAAVRPLPDDTGFAVEVFGRTVQVAARVLAGHVLADADLYAAASLADWTHVHGYVLVTAADTRATLAYARSLSAAGYPLEVVCWADERDDAGLKHAIVHAAR